MRRVRVFPTADPDVASTVKLGLVSKTLVTEDTLVVPGRGRRAPGYSVGAAAGYSGGALVVAAFVLKDDGSFPIPTAAGSFRIWTVDQATWAETLVATVAGTPLPAAGGISASISEATLGFELAGDVLFAVEATVERYGRPLRKKFYVNDVGIYEYADFLRRKINLVEILSR